MAEEISETRHLITIDGVEFSVRSRRDGSSYSFFELLRRKATTVNDKTYAPPENLIVLDSVKSGKGRVPQNDIYSIVMKPILDSLGCSHTVIKTESHDTVSEFARGLDMRMSYTVIFISGDTSISEFINNLCSGSRTVNQEKSKLCILPVPMGTGNAWASSLLHADPIESFGRYIRGSLRLDKFPLYRAVFPNNYSIVFFIIFSLGFHANLLHACEDPKLKKLGTERFKIAAEEVLHKYDLNLDITVGNCARSYAYFALINTTNLESTYKPSPLSDPLKSELHLLGYSSSLDREGLTKKIMQGYQNNIGDALPDDANVIYKALHSDFDVALDYSKSSSNHNFEICCDGTLINFLEQQVENAYSNKIHIEFLTQYSNFSLHVFH